MKYPVVIPYIHNGNGRELRYAIRSLANIRNWNGEIVLIGDKPNWYTGTHIPRPQQSDRFQDVYSKMLLATTLYESFIWSNDDIYITEPTTISAYYDESTPDPITRHKRILAETFRG